MKDRAGDVTETLQSWFSYSKGKEEIASPWLKIQGHVVNRCVKDLECVLEAYFTRKLKSKYLGVTTLESATVK